MQAAAHHAGGVLHAAHDDANPYALPPPVPHAAPPPAPPRAEPTPPTPPAPHATAHAPPDATGSLLKPRHESKSQQAPDDPSRYAWDETGLHVQGRPEEATSVEQWEDDPNLPVDQRPAAKPAPAPEKPATAPPRPAIIERQWAPPPPPLAPAAHAVESDDNPYAAPAPAPAGQAAAPASAPPRAATPVAPEYQPPSPLLKAKEKLLDLARPAAIGIGAIVLLVLVVQGFNYLRLLQGDTTANQQPVVRIAALATTTVPQNSRVVIDLSASDDPDGDEITFELRTQTANGGEVVLDDRKQAATTRSPFLTAERQITLIFTQQGTVTIDVLASDRLAFSAPKRLEFTVTAPIR